MAEGEWESAYAELYQAFRHYQEAGNARAKDCLKYVVLASMLALTDVNPFAAREAKAFAEDREIQAMSDLRASLEANDLNRFERILRQRGPHQRSILEEPFLMKYIEPLRRRMREQALLGAIKPYRSVTLSHLATMLTLSPEEVESLLVELVVDERLSARIDQSKNIVEITGNDSGQTQLQTAKTKAILNWIQNLENITAEFDNRVGLF